MNRSKTPIIGITLGDVNGVGPEVIIKTLMDQRITEFCIPVVYASPKIFSFYKKLLGYNEFNLFIAKGVDQLNAKRPNVLVCWEEEIEIKPGEVTDIAGKYALRSLELATADLKEGKIDGLLTAPLNKHNIPAAQSGEKFIGHTEYLAHALSAPEHLMFLLSSELKMGLATGHLPLKEVAGKLSVEKIVSKLRVMKKSLFSDFGLSKPRIALLGLNPHAGDNGLLGTEDKDIIAKAAEAAQNENIYAFGPYPADGFFGSRQYKSFDAVMAMYHDQGLIPFKHLAFEEGVNYTAGLAAVRTSPDHGTGYNLAGKNQASEISFRNALYAAVDIIRHRHNSDEITANPLPFTPLRRERFRIDF